MSYHTHTACHLLRPAAQGHHTPQGEEAYYRSHTLPALRLPAFGSVAAALRRARVWLRAAPAGVPAVK